MLLSPFLGLRLLCWLLLFLFGSSLLATFGALGWSWFFGLLLGLCCLGLLGSVLTLTLSWALPAASQPVVGADIRGLLLAVETERLLLKLEE